MATVVGSARIDEKGNVSGGAVGDNNGKEVATQNFYVASKGWYIIRATDAAVATALGKAMKTACDNDNIGYDQSNRLGVIKYGINTKTKTEADCSSLVRACCIAAGFDPGNFTTANEATILNKTGKFEPKVKFVDEKKTPLYVGDILVTCTKGHTVIVTSGNSRTAAVVETVKQESVSYKTFTVNTGGANLNIRKGAGTNFDIVGKLANGAKIEIAQESRGWGYLKNKTGWVSMKYLK